MADLQARRAAIQKASSQVRSGGVSVRRSTATGSLRSSRAAKVLSVWRLSAPGKHPAKNPR
jgi:hypothetical protein